MDFIQTIQRLNEAEKATTAGKILRPLLNKIFDREYAKGIKITQKENIITVKFPIDSGAGGYLSVGGKDTMSGQDRKKSIKKAEDAAKELERHMIDMYDEQMEDHWIENNSFGFVAHEGKFWKPGKDL